MAEREIFDLSPRRIAGRPTWTVRIAGLANLEVGELGGHRLAEDQRARVPCQGLTVMREGTVRLTGR
jgi:hypothetical protein